MRIVLIHLYSMEQPILSIKFHWHSVQSARRTSGTFMFGRQRAILSLPFLEDCAISTLRGTIAVSRLGMNKGRAGASSGRITRDLIDCVVKNPDLLEPTRISEIQEVPKKLLTRHLHWYKDFNLWSVSKTNVPNWLGHSHTRFPWL